MRWLKEQAASLGVYFVVAPASFLALVGVIWLVTELLE